MMHTTKKIALAFGLAAAAGHPVSAQSPEVQLVSAVFQSHSGESVNLSTVPLGAGPTSGDFHIQVNLTGQLETTETVQYAWCFLQSGVVVTHPAVGTYFTNGRMEDISFDVATVPFSMQLQYGYRIAHGAYYPDAPLGSVTLRVFVGGSALYTDGSSAPTGVWGAVDVPFSVDDVNMGHRILVEGHRLLQSGQTVDVCITRPSTTGNDVYDIWVGSGSAELASGLAVFTDGNAHTTVPMTLFDLGPVVLYSTTSAGELITSATLLVVGGDEPESPLPPNSAVGYHCSFSGGAESLKNPKLFCGDCAWFGTPTTPPECGANPTGTFFVQNGRCAKNWSTGATCCSWSKVDVPNSRTYIMTAGPYVTTCRYGFSFIVSWTPVAVCCAWNVDFSVPPATAQYNRCTTKPYMFGSIGCP
jgi:hypothetical protein